MKSTTAFVDVRDVTIKRIGKSGVINRLIGRQPTLRTLVKDLSFKLDHGDQVTLYGGEGTGKTTVLRLLAGALKPSSGTVLVNGLLPEQIKDIAAGYVSSEESEPRGDTAYEILYGFGSTHKISDLSARINVVADAAGVADLYHPAQTLSTTERLRLNLARAALSDAPLILLDDVADSLDITTVKDLLDTLFTNRTIIIATRSTDTAEQLDLPMLLLHKATLAQSGTRHEIATALNCPRIVDVWIEGLRYDVLRKLRQHAGVVDVRLVPSSRFAGQRLRVTLHSSRYLPALYDLVSQTPLIRVEELPPSLNDIIKRLG